MNRYQVIRTSDDPTRAFIIDLTRQDPDGAIDASYNGRALVSEGRREDQVRLAALLNAEAATIPGLDV